MVQGPIRGLGLRNESFSVQAPCFDILLQPLGFEATGREPTCDLVGEFISPKKTCEPSVLASAKVSSVLFSYNF